MREERTIRLFELWGVLASNVGTILTLKDLEPFRRDHKITVKTLRRDLAAVGHVSWMAVECRYNRQGMIGWRVVELPRWARQELPVPERLKCSKCGRVQPSEDFYADSSKRYGKDTWCKQCRTRSNEKWRPPKGYYADKGKRGRRRRQIRNRVLE